MSQQRKSKGVRARWQGGSRLIALGRANEVERFLPRHVVLCLVQCWRCRKDETRQPGIGKPEEIRCSRCGGEVEVLTIDGATQK